MTGAAPPNGYTLEARGEDAGPLTLVLRGRLSVESAGRLPEAAAKLLAGRHPASLVLDLSQVAYVDSAGALALTLTQERAAQDGLTCQFQGVSSQAAQMLALVNPADLAVPPLRPAQVSENLFEGLGGAFLELWAQSRVFMVFVGELTLAFGRLFMQPGKMRWGEVSAYMEQVGVQGLGIVALVSFLLGLIMAFMSSLQLKSFGADIYVATLVSVAMVRELGPIMTAILVAGRSGSSFAAEIGTMKVNEEVDALTVMGFDTTLFLVMPKILAAVITVPILTLFADLVAILGGLTVGVVGLDLTPYAYMNQTMKSLSASDITTTIWKAAVFALIIAGIGCQRGLTVSKGAAGVGRATTSAVVAALFMIIVADSFFAILLYYVF
ncbi:MAG: ABC transporter permease [Deltaproteobacteria bacterium]|nr:ABC transporter permease [Deltaproteobacteria bacterium]